MENISKLIAKHDWHAIVNHVAPNLLAKSLSFIEGRALAYKILLNDERDDDLREYACNLLNEVRLVYPQDWQKDWKNDVFLGDACYLTMKYEEKYEAYKRACENVNPVPPSLLISLAGCYISPTPSISLQEAETLVQQALKEEISIEGVILMRGICKRKEDQVQVLYWDKVLKEVEEKNVHTERNWPDLEI